MTNRNFDYDFIVVGGGPAGMLAAATAGAQGCRVLLLERNEKLGKKLYITGKGRCNVTNNGNADAFKDNIVTNHKFLYGALHKFDNTALVALLNTWGVKTKVERGQRVFPSSDKSSDVIKALHKYLLHAQVVIQLHTRVKQLLVGQNKIRGVVLDTNQTITAPRVLLATGGMSYPSTGSTGDGHQMARRWGHSATPPRPALVPLEIKESWVKQLQGLTLKNIQVQGLVQGKIKAAEFGELLFTHFGVSGPVILTISSYIGKHTNKPLSLILDLKPALTLEQLDQRVLKDFARYHSKQIKNALDDLLPQNMIPVVLNLAQLEGSTPVHQITKLERLMLVQTLKQIRLTVTRTRPLKEAIITAGGINVKEINPSTMESKIVQGLYLAGEIIDVDALTGGYNLQIAFSTGYLSGHSAATR